MKNIIAYVFQNRKSFIVTFCFILIGIMYFSGNAHFKKNQRVLFETELINAKESLRDSITSAKNAELKIKTDSIQKSERAKSDYNKRQADKWEAKADKLGIENVKLQGAVDNLLNEYGDSLDVNCRKVLTAYQKQVDGLKKQRDALDSTVTKLNISLKADRRGWDACISENKTNMETIDSKVDLLVIKDNTITDLKKQLEKDNNFFNRNKGWGGLAIGIIMGIVIF